MEQASSVHQTDSKKIMTRKPQNVEPIRELNNVVINDQAAEAVQDGCADNLVACRGEMAGCQIGELRSIPPTDRDASRTGHCFFRIDDGRIAQARILSDGKGLMKGIGPIPEGP